MPYVDWLLTDWRAIRKHPRMAVALLMIGALVAWWSRGVTVSNLRSQVALLETRLEFGPDLPLDPLPSYTLGGVSVTDYLMVEKWITPRSSRSVELDWNALGDIEAEVVLRMSALGGPSWIEGRLLNVTDSDIVATSPRLCDGNLSWRSPLPRATGAKTYVMQYRGYKGGLLGDIHLVRARR